MIMGLFRLIPGPQIHDSWALPQWGRVRFKTANRGDSSCRLRYRYARILMRRSCGVWPGEAKMALKPDGFWRQSVFWAGRNPCLPGPSGPARDSQHVALAAVRYRKEVGC